MPEQPNTRNIELEIEIDAPRDAAWRALTTAEELSRWFPPISGGNGAEVNQKLLISWGDAMEWWTTVAEADPEKHVRWLDDPEAYERAKRGESNEPALAVDWFIETRNGRTVVRLVHSGFATTPDWDDQFDGLSGGWRYFLHNLRHYLERHRGTPRVMISERRRSPVTNAELWNRLLGAQGLGIVSAPDQLPAEQSSHSVSFGGRPVAMTVEHVSPMRLWFRVPEMNDALFFVEAEGRKTGFNCGLWLSTYGLSDAQAADARESLRALSDRVFAPAS